MKKILSVCILYFCFLTVSMLHGQIAMKVEMTQIRFLQYEPVYARLTVRNLSGHPLVFGENAGLRGSLRFEITGLGFAGYAKLLKNENPTMKGIILQPGAIRVFTYNVSAFYDLRRQDSYNLKAVISHPQLGASYESNKTAFSIVSGQEIWQALVGIPEVMQKKVPGSIPTRKYRIVSYNTGKRYIYSLYIEDNKRVYSTRHLGVDLGYTLRPKCAIDDLSRLHVILAASPKVFAYYLFDVNGKLEKKEVRIKTDSQPRLVTNRDMGTVLLTGGRRARPDLDYEEIRSLPYIQQAMEEHTGDITSSSGKGLLDDK